VRLLSRRSVELMTHDQLGRISADHAFGFSLNIDGVKGRPPELGSPGTYSMGGFFLTMFSIDPKEQMIVIFMAQLHPAAGVGLARGVSVLAHQAKID
jgi:CubicO group peptidase (beta-lactamase class C family)